MFSPAQSLRRLMSSSPGRSALPPSHPHAAARDAVEAPAASFKNPRRSVDLVMAGKSPAVAAGEHRAQRSGVHREHQNHVDDRERDEDPHDPEVPKARRLEPPEQGGEPGELQRLVDREPGQHRERAEQVDARVRELLERVVLPLRRMVLAEAEVIPRHLDRAAHIARAEQQRAPLAASHEITEVQQPHRHEGPHEGEVPIQRAREPAAQPAPGGKPGVVERARQEWAAAVPEAGVGLVDLEAARDHAGEHQNRRPMRDTDDPMVAADRCLPRGRGRGGGRGRGRRCGGGSRAVAHGGNIFHVMRYATLLGFGCITACQGRGVTRTHLADSLDLATLVPRDSTDSALVTPRVVTEPSVVLFWLRAADTLGVDDQAEAFDDLKYYTEQVASALQSNGIRLVATNADTVYVALPNNKLRPILLSGLDFPFGYLFIDPGGPERILTGVYADEELMDELRAYFDLSDDSTAVQPRITT